MSGAAPQSPRNPPTDRPPSEALRRLILVLIVIGAGGLLLELFFLEHTESLQQWIPFAVLGVSLMAALNAAFRPSRAALHTVRASMIVCIAAGLLGLYFHHRGNTEFELERNPAARGLGLLWKTLRGATPTLAPGAMVQLGLLGLVFTYRHPALEEPQENS